MKKWVVLASLLLVASCSHQHHKHKGHGKTGQDITIGESLTANKYSNLYFSAQPRQGDYQKLKSQGFETVINLRAVSEYDEPGEHRAVKSNKMKYVNIPFAANENLTDEYIALVTSEVKKHRKNGKILIHCGSGNRVGIWLGGHFFKDHGLNKKESVAMAQKLGLTNDGALKKLNRYLDSK